MKIEIKKVDIQDVRNLAEFAQKTYTDAFGHDFIDSDLKAHLEKTLSLPCFEHYMKEDIFLLAQSNQNIVGYIQMGPAKSENYDIEICDTDQELRRLYVLNNFQRMGIGRKLIDEALAHPNFAKAKRIFLDVWEDNKDAKKLYESYGFKEIGKRSFEVESGIATGFDLIMVRPQDE